MFTGSIKALIAKYGRQRLVRTMRGYRYLKQSGEISRMNALQYALTVTELRSCKGRCSRLIFGAGVDNAELSIRQFLMVRVSAVAKLNGALLQALGTPGSGVIHYVPPDWQVILRQHGFKVSSLWCILAWQGFVATRFYKGVVNIAQIAWASALHIKHSSTVTLSEYVYFDGMDTNNLPQPDADGRSHDIFSWYEKWAGRVANLEALCHAIHDAAPTSTNKIPVVGMRWPVPPLANTWSLMRFLIWGVMATCLALFDWLRGRWWHALLLGEGATAALVRMQPASNLAQEYLFTQSRICDRPLYTYEAEQRGAQITFYFYSTNSERISRSSGHHAQLYMWQAMNWPRYLVGDSYQVEFVHKMVGTSAKVSIVGPIWFSTCAIDAPQIPEKAIAIFDIQPIRISFYVLHAEEDDYFVPYTSTQFTTDSFICLQSIGAHMVFKRKRQLSSRYHPRYIGFLERMGRWDKMITVDPDTSAYKLIEKCSAVISMPFTSTALIARELGKPSCFYDPTGLIQRDDRAAHGIPIMIGRVELQAWLEALELPMPTR